MKKYLLTLSAVAIALTSCDLDINDNPNTPDNEAITADLVFPSVQNAIMATSCDIMFNYAGFFAQYFEQMPEANQFNKIADYSITESDQTIDRAYLQLYARALEDIDVVLGKVSNKADILAATAMRAFAFQLMVDNTSDAPYTEALKGSAVPQPKWDDGKTVYMGIIDELTKALADYQANPDAMTMTDLMFDKNAGQWEGYANALLLRMYFRMYDAGLTEYKDKIVALVNDNKFFKGDVTIDIFSDQTDNRSPFYASYYALGTSNHCASYPIISYMTSTNDPRIAYCFNKSVKDDDYVGQLPGAKALSKTWNGGDWKNSNVSVVNYSLFDGSGVERPAYLYTQANLQFLIAEANVRFINDDAAAQAAYEAAIEADFDAKGIAGYDAFIAGPKVAWAGATDKLNLIYMQKWAALCYMDNMEAWSEIRRTDVPVLSNQKASDIFADATIYTPGDLIEPAENGIEAGGLMKRMFYPKKARDLNKNTPSPKKGSDPVWWDIH
jgi:hypothetical protein